MLLQQFIQVTLITKFVVVAGVVVTVVIHSTDISASSVKLPLKSQRPADEDRSQTTVLYQCIKRAMYR